MKFYIIFFIFTYTNLNNGMEIEESTDITNKTVYISNNEWITNIIVPDQYQEFTEREKDGSAVSYKKYLSGDKKNIIECYVTLPGGSKHLTKWVGNAGTVSNINKRAFDKFLKRFNELNETQ